MKNKGNIFNIFLGLLVFLFMPLPFFYMHDIVTRNLLILYFSIMVPFSVFEIISLYKIPKEKAHPYLAAFRLFFFLIPLGLIIALPFSSIDILITLGISLLGFIIPFVSKKLTYLLLTAGGNIPMGTLHNEWFGDELKNITKVNSKIVEIFFLIVIAGGAAFSHWNSFGLTDYIPLFIMDLLLSICVFLLSISIATEIKKGQYLNNLNK